MNFFKYDGSAVALTLASSRDFSSADGAETLTGTTADETFWGGQGDRMIGGAGDDTYYLQGGDTRVIEAAGEGVDKIVAWQNVHLGDHPAVENLTVGNDKLYGAGNALDNVIEGQGGGQQLYGGLGQDVLIGGAGADVFIVVKGEGNDVVQDFAAGEDRVRLDAGFTSFEQVKAAMTQVGADVKLDLGGGDALMFRNITIGQFAAADFQLGLDWAKVGQLTFAEEFSAPISIWDPQSNPDGVWRPDLAYQGPQGHGSYALLGNGETQVYTSPYYREHAGDFAESGIVNNGDGTLSLVARHTTNPEVTSFGSDITSGWIMTRHSASWVEGEGNSKGFSQTYGYFEMRADLSEVKGTWGAFWMTGDDWSWPPELDILENPIGDPHVAWTTVHSNETGSHTAKGQANFVPNHLTGYHTYSALWAPDTVTFFVDRVEVFKVRTPADMNKPMNLIANLATGGWAGSTPTADLLPAEMKIDYIRAYALADGSTVIGAPTPAPAPAPAPTPAPVPAGEPAPAAAGVLMARTESAVGEDLNGTAAADTLMAGFGDDRVNGGDGLDFMRGGEGHDIMSGGGGFDDMHGNQGQDTMAGNDGDDWVVGGKDADRLFGDEGDDIVYGNIGNDLCDGGAGADIIRGGQDDDVMFGWSGNDWMSGDRGADTMQGGSGADTFHTFAEAGVDLVLDFNFAEGDRVQLLSGTSWSVAQEGGDTVVRVGDAQLILQGVQLSSLGDGWLFGA